MLAKVLSTWFTYLIFGVGQDFDQVMLEDTDLVSGGLSNKLELGFECENLPKLDANLNDSDPFCVLYKQQGSDSSWTQIGKTEIIHDNANPKFKKKFMVDFRFEKREVYKVEVYDADDSQTDDLSAHDFIGSLEFQMHEVVTA